MQSSQLKEYNKTSHRIQASRILIVNVKEKLSELVGRRIRELSTTNAEVARQTGLSRGYIGNIVNETAPTQSGQYNLSPETVGKLAKVLQISESEILQAMDYLSSEVQLIRNRIRVSDFDDFNDKDLDDIAEYIALKKLKNKGKE